MLAVKPLVALDHLGLFEMVGTSGILERAKHGHIQDILVLF